jgi:electron transfer flavoprotein alpha subunit
MGRILIVGPIEQGAVHPGTREVAALAALLSTAMQLPIVGTVAGHGEASCLAEMAHLGTDEVLALEDLSAPPVTPDCIAAQIIAVALACQATVVLAPHTLDTAEWLPLVAARLDAGIVTDCQAVAFDNVIVATKMICGGAIGAEYAVERDTAVLSISAGAYAACAPTATTAPIRRIAAELPPPAVSIIENVVANATDGPPLKQASIVIAGGLGIGKRDNWPLVTELALILDAAVGASRAVVESGWAPYSQQVGYSGVKVAPQLYIAIGISGALHHLAGISQARAIVAINVDPKADIFKVAQFGVIGDAAAVVPALTQRLREIKKHRSGN